jgi:hypothetical protein
LRWYSAIGSRDRSAINAANDVILRRAKDPGYDKISTLAALLFQQGNWREMARTFIIGKHHHRDLMAIIFAGISPEEDQEDARDSLEARWKHIAPDSWDGRLRDGDKSVWYEMLLANYLDKPIVERAELLATLSDEQAFMSSRFSSLALPRRGMLCEFLFYDALKAKAGGDRAQTIAGFQGVIGTQHRRYEEYDLAEYLLPRENSR